MAMMERAMTLFAPFYKNGIAAAEAGEAGATEAAATDADAAPASAEDTAEVQAMRSEIDMLRKQLAAARSLAVVPAETTEQD